MGSKGKIKRKEPSKGTNIKINNKSVFLGSFNNPKDAYKAYCEASKKYQGEFSKLK